MRANLIVIPAPGFDDRLVDTVYSQIGDTWATDAISDEPLVAFGGRMLDWGRGTCSNAAASISGP